MDPAPAPVPAPPPEPVPHPRPVIVPLPGDHGAKVATVAVATPVPSAASVAARARPRKLPPLDARERRAALQVSTLEGMFALGHMALSGNGLGGNVFTYGYALLLGAKNFHLGVLTAVPQLATAAQVVSAYAVQRVRSRRRLVILACIVSRSLFFLAPFLPWMLGREAALDAFIALFGLAAVTFHIAGNGWNSWMSDLVPSGLRGRYFARRNNLCNLVGLVTGFTGAYALDWFAGGASGSSPEADARRLTGFIGVFLLAGAFGAVSTFLLRYQPEPEPTAGPPPLRFGDLAAIPFRDRSFRRVLLVFALFNFGNGLGNPFWVPYFLEDLGKSYALLTTLTAAGGVAGLLTLPLWGRLIDRFGARPCLLLFGVIVSLHPLYYLVASREFFPPIVLDYLSSGTFWNAWNLAALDLIITIAPAERGRRAAYLAAQAAVAGCAIAAGSFLSGAIADTIPGGRQSIFLCVTLLRWVALSLVARIDEPGARPFAEILRAARDVAVRRA